MVAPMMTAPAVAMTEMFTMMAAVTVQHAAQIYRVE